MFQNVQQVQAFIRERGIQFVDFKMIDLRGRWKHLSIPAVRFTQDILENGMNLDVDVYQAGHHGSRSSSTEDFLDAMSPEYAVISCAEGNSYGHPHAQTLNNLRARRIKVFRTDEQGSIVAYSDGTEITWNCSPSDSWQSGEPSGNGK